MGNVVRLVGVILVVHAWPAEAVVCGPTGKCLCAGADGLWRTRITQLSEEATLTIESIHGNSAGRTVGDTVNVAAWRGDELNAEVLVWASEGSIIQRRAIRSGAIDCSSVSGGSMPADRAIEPALHPDCFAAVEEEFDRAWCAPLSPAGDRE